MRIYDLLVEGDIIQLPQKQNTDVNKNTALKTGFDKIKQIHNSLKNELDPDDVKDIITSIHSTHTQSVNKYSQRVEQIRSSFKKKLNQYRLELVKIINAVRNLSDGSVIISLYAIQENKQLNQVALVFIKEHYKEIDNAFIETYNELIRNIDMINDDISRGLAVSLDSVIEQSGQQEFIYALGEMHNYFDKIVGKH